ncbi:DUF2946 domain-containing protein [Sphingomonas sp. NCPPB 2930]
MRIGIVGKRILSWVACLAILMSSLAPAISHALRAGSGGNWIEVCSVTGSKLVRVDDGAGKTAPDLPSHNLLDHCPYCALHATAFAPPPAPMAGLPASALSFELPPLFLSAPRTLHAWRTSRPRGPPALS